MPDPLVITRSYAAGLARVWDAWTQPGEVATWYCPNPALETTARLDVRPGGRHEVDMGPGFALRGVYSTVAERELLGHTWSFNGGHETRVSVSFTATTDGTDVVVTHDGFEDDEERDGIEQGWGITLGRLEQVLRPAG